MSNNSRILFTAPKSGSGKTMITCGMIALCKRKGMNVVSFKCGPDYIDPMFHREVLGISSGNLDTFFTDRETTRYLLQKGLDGADIGILEGVMGYYDGLGGVTDQGSTWEVAQVTDTPSILIVDAKGASVSLVPLIKGILEYKENSNIKGIILNKMSAGYYERLKTLIEEQCHIPVIGYVPVMKELAIPSRHLGLIAPEELESFQQWENALVDTLEQTIDFEMLMDIAKKAGNCEGEKPNFPVLPREVRIGVARDEAFSFYYKENLELLEEMGVTLCYFSPLHDKKLPENLDGLLLGGGYPENYVKQLEEATEIRKEIKKLCVNNIPCLAECGGFLYLQQALEGSDGENANMVGVLSGNGFRTSRLQRFGYIELTCEKSGLVGEIGDCIKAHEFHYWDCTVNGEDFLATKPIKTASSKDYNCMIHTNTMLAGFPHLYYYSNPNMIVNYLTKCLEYQTKRMAQAHWDSIAKPIGSLGLLEDMVIKFCGILMNPYPKEWSKRAVIDLCGDHGVVCEGVAQAGSEITKIVSENFSKGCSTVNHMAKIAKADVYTVDMGIATDHYPTKEVCQNAVIDRKIAKGTKNLAVESAMTVKQCKQAINVGIELVRELKERGYCMIATGEMGIGNTTPTSVLSALFLNLTAQEVTGKGAGLSEESFQRKINVIERAIKRIKQLNLTSPIELLAQAGGYEIAGMVGVFLGGAKYRVPIIIDGAISSVSALVATEIDQRVKDILIASHESEELTGRLALEKIGVQAPLHAKMRLGEGTGAVVIYPLLDMAMEVYTNMGTFSEYKIASYPNYEDDETNVSTSESK